MNRSRIFVILTAAILMLAVNVFPAAATDDGDILSENDAHVCVVVNSCIDKSEREYGH